MSVIITGMTMPNNCNDCGIVAEKAKTTCKSNGCPLKSVEGLIKQIRAEIEAARYIDKDTKLCKNANASGLEVAMQIIDKYRESEG